MASELAQFLADLRSDDKTEEDKRDLFRDIVEKGNLKLLKKVLPEHPTGHTGDLLETALAANRPKIMRLLLKREADGNLLSQNKVPLIIVAAEKGALECLEALINSGADVNQTCEVGIQGCSSALGRAVEENHPKCVRVLVRAGADLNSRTCCLAGKRLTWLHLNWYHTPLTCAVHADKIQIAKLLINSGRADLEAVSGHDRFTPILYAIEMDRDELLEYLLKKGADPNGRGGFENLTPLMLAAEVSNYHAMKILLNTRRVDVNAVDAHGNTALVKTVLEQPPLHPMIATLYYFGAHVNKGDDSNVLTLFLENSSFREGDEELALLMYAAGEKIDRKYLNENYDGSLSDDTNDDTDDSDDEDEDGEREDGKIQRAIEKLIPDRIKCYESDISLKNLSRQSVRSHLLNVDPHNNLLCRIPDWTVLPQSLNEYLLYNIDWEDIAIVVRAGM